MLHDLFIKPAMAVRREDVPAVGYDAAEN